MMVSKGFVGVGSKVWVARVAGFSIHAAARACMRARREETKVVPLVPLLWVWPPRRPLENDAGSQGYATIVTSSRAPRPDSVNPAVVRSVRGPPLTVNDASAMPV